MADDLMLEVLKDVQQRLVTLDHDMREEFGRVNLRLAAIEENTAGILAVGASDRAKIDRLEKRIERIERRLELTD